MNAQQLVGCAAPQGRVPWFFNGVVTPNMPVTDPAPPVVTPPIPPQGDPPVAPVPPPIEPPPLPEQV